MKAKMRVHPKLFDVNESTRQKKVREDVERRRHRLKLVRDSLDHYTDKLSNITRILNFGLLGTVLAIFTTDSKYYSLSSEPIVTGLSVATALKFALLCVSISLLIDVIQYVIPVWRDTLLLAKVSDDTAFQVKLWPKESKAKRWMGVLFWSKVSVSAAGAVWIGFNIWLSI